MNNSAAVQAPPVAPLVDYLEDNYKKYADTYARLLDGSPIYISRPTSPDGEPVHEEGELDYICWPVEKNLYGHYYTDMEEENSIVVNHDEIDFSFPATGYFNIEVGNKKKYLFCAYLMRQAKRQWRRTATTGNTSIFVPEASALGSYLRGKKAHKAFVRYSMLVEALLQSNMGEEKYISLEEATNLLYAGKAFSCAIGNRWAVSSTAEHEFPVLYHDTNKVGYLREDGTLHVSSCVSFLKEQLQELGEVQFV